MLERLRAVIVQLLDEVLHVWCHTLLTPVTLSFHTLYSIKTKMVTINEVTCGDIQIRLFYLTYTAIHVVIIRNLSHPRRAVKHDSIVVVFRRQWWPFRRASRPASRWSRSHVDVRECRPFLEWLHLAEQGTFLFKKLMEYCRIAFLESQWLLL